MYVTPARRAEKPGVELRRIARVAVERLLEDRLRVEGRVRDPEVLEAYGEHRRRLELAARDEP